MKKLCDFFDTSHDVLIKDIKINSKEVEKGDLFLCVKGINCDRHDFISEAIENGASCIIGSRDIECPILYIKVPDCNKILTKLCQDFYDFKKDDLKIIGVTGTDGKTTTSTCIQTLIGKDKCGYIGTNGCSCQKFVKDSPNSTPDQTFLYKTFHEFKEAGCSYVVIEATSEGFFRNRLENLKFTVGGYTNVTWEHVNIHGSFENYLQSKTQLAKQTTGNFIVNSDDPYSKEFIKNNHQVLTYGLDKNNTIYIKDYIITPKYTDVTFIYNDLEYSFKSPLLGGFNVYNLACSFLICLSLGFDIDYLIERVLDIDVKGRLEMIELGQKFKVMVDYAHTPNGIKSLLDFVRILNLSRIIVVIGSAGERDYVKRPIMGKTVIENADYAIFTYEDPRSEEPLDIIKQMVKEIDDENKYEIVVDRSLAIKRAIDIANDNDIVLVLGKGNETYQKLKDKVIYFNDIIECKKWVQFRLEKEKVLE